MRALVLLALAPLAACGGQPATDTTPARTPGVLVGVHRATRGSTTDWLTAYGSAGPSISGTDAISVPQAGQVTRLAVTPGVAVRAGQVLAVFATDPSVVSGYQQAATSLAAARQQRATAALLLTQQLATRDQVTQADKAVSDAQVALEALRQQGAGQPTRTLFAPFAGVVTAVSVAQGDRTQPGAPLMTVARSGSIVATVGLDPAQAARVRTGQQARVSRLNGGPPLSGRVLRVGGVLNPKTRLIDVDLTFPAGAVLPNEALRGDIAVGLSSGWLIPHRALVTANGPTRVFQVVAGKAHAVAVTLLLPGEQVDVVDGPVDPDRPLIVDGAYQVEEGAAVRTR